MSSDELKERLNKVADKLVPVAGELMSRACRDDFIHEEDCTCNTCLAFLATQECQNEIERIVKEL